jgi:hypothetical protein
MDISWVDFRKGPLSGQLWMIRDVNTIGNFPSLTTFPTMAPLGFSVLNIGLSACPGGRKPHVKHGSLR